uniref:Uncharacterized protein n=1 Tax=Anguilla anguilla TaxID=7936 RepID=A0A0E9R924_ANGAN
MSLHSRPPPPRVHKCISVSKADIKVNGEELLGSHLFIKGARGPGELASACLLGAKYQPHQVQAALDKCLSTLVH